MEHAKQFRLFSIQELLIFSQKKTSINTWIFPPFLSVVSIKKKRQFYKLVTKRRSCLCNRETAFQWSWNVVNRKNYAQCRANILVLDAERMHPKWFFFLFSLAMVLFSLQFHFHIQSIYMPKWMKPAKVWSCALTSLCGFCGFELCSIVL